VADTVQPGDHGGTYAGNPLAAAAANATLRVVREDKLVERAADVGGRVLDLFASFAAEHPELAIGAKGRGLLVGLALADAERAAALPKRALDAGVLVNVTAGNVMRLFPALNIPEDELFAAIEVLFGLIREG